MVRRVVVFLIGACIVFLVRSSSMPRKAMACSGIRFAEITMLESTNPPCDAERETTFRVRIRNANDVCNEDVVISAFNFAATPLAGFEFVGLKKTLDDSPTPTIRYSDMEDESSETFYIVVRTRPVPVTGCDFLNASFNLHICDRGGGCDWGPFPDDFCEEDTPLTPPVEIRADSLLCPQVSMGTGIIRGTVTGPAGFPVVGARVRATRGCMARDNRVNAVVTTRRWPRAERGAYEITGLPFPATYQVEAQSFGRCATASVTVDASGEATQDLMLVALSTCP